MDEQPTMTIDSLGTKIWYRKGQFHRTDGPAVEYGDGSTEWFQRGRRHREDGPAREYSGGAKVWLIHGQIHREDGPAVENGDGSLEWYRHHQLHREDGPAVEYPDGTTRWFWRGVQVPQHVVLYPETLTVEEIDSQPNAEVRRVMIDRLGLDRYVTQAQFETVAQDDFGTLLRKHQHNDENLAVVKVVCPSTGHVHFLRVPPGTNTPLEGVAWTFDMSPRDYLLTAEA